MNMDQAIKSVFTLFLSLLLLVSCSDQTDPLDKIKEFRSEDKYFKATMKGLHFIIESSTTGRIDSVFKQIIEVYDLPIDATGIPDGTYTGESPGDAYDYRHVVTIEVKDGKIISADYDEVLPSGRGKEGDVVYNEQMSITGTTPSVAYPLLEKQIVEKQNMMEVDAVSGATYSLYRFRYALTVALINGKISLEF
jgi:major membrane immunogen (membrane-anchored lipoprotein)